MRVFEEFLDRLNPEFADRRSADAGYEILLLLGVQRQPLGFAASKLPAGHINVAGATFRPQHMVERDMLHLTAIINRDASRSPVPERHRPQYRYHVHVSQKGRFRKSLVSTRCRKDGE